MAESVNDISLGTGDIEHAADLPGVAADYTLIGEFHDFDQEPSRALLRIVG